MGNDLVQDAASNRRSLISDAVGILAIGVQLYWVVRWLVPDDGSRLTLSVLASPGEWALAIPASVLIGAVSFGADVFVGMINNPKLPPIEAGTKAGSPFGFLLTVMICPGFTMLAVAGLLRALLLRSGSARISQP